jgi:hypothetical protein
MANDATLINAVKTPLGFFVLVVGVIQAVLLAGMKLVEPNLHQLILIIFAAITVLLIILVGGIAVWKPEALSGKPYDVEILGHSIGSEVFYSFDPYISNLPDQERMEAYQSLLSQMESPGDTANQLIRKKIAAVIRERAGITSQ